MIKCFTSLANNYIPMARALAESVKNYHPDWEFTLVLAEDPPDHFKMEDEPFDKMILPEEIGIPNLKGWLFKHTALEVCGGLKGIVANLILNQSDTEKLIYLDPDMIIFNPLDRLIEILDKHAVVFTPHILSPEETNEDVSRIELKGLAHGIYNLGMIAISRKVQGINFTKWWRERLLNFCYVDIEKGLYVDQRWCDLAPVFFDDIFILKDPAYNVARWNHARRDISFNKEGTLLACGEPLAVYHFSGFNQRSITIPRKYLKDDNLVYEIWGWYEWKLICNELERFSQYDWKYNRFDDETPIMNGMRAFYREKEDLQEHFPDPFDTYREDGGFLSWYKRNKMERRLINSMSSAFRIFKRNRH